MEAWLVWGVVALLLAAGEAVTAGLLLIMLAGGALAAGVGAAVGLPVVAQAAIFALVSVGLIAFVRPVAKQHLYQAPAKRSGTAALVGSFAVVTETVDASDGRIKLAGEIWSARTLDEDARFEPGAKVSVFQIDGATAVVG